MSSAKNIRHVEISERFVQLGAQHDGSRIANNSHVSLADDHDDGDLVETSTSGPGRTGTRNAMGEFVPGKGERVLTQQAFSGPGPSSYSPEVQLTKPMVPHYSIVGKAKEKQESLSPGPKYDTSENMMWSRKKRSLKAKLETSPYRPKARDHLTCSLGSAAYKVEYYDTGRHVPRYTIGSRFREPVILGPPNIAVEPVDTQGFTAPSPSYSPRQNRGLKKSFGLQLKPTRDGDIPGPAEYTVGNCDHGPEYSLGHKLYDLSLFVNPGPGSYDIKSTIGSGVATSIRGRGRVRPEYSVPSPNTYVLPDTFKDAPRHSITNRTIAADVCETPGPANYDQDCEEIWKKRPEYSCGKQCRPSFPAILNYPEYETVISGEGSKRARLMKNKRVGPDTYDADKGFDKNSSPAHSMGNRYSSTANDYPGPNHYTIRLPCRPDGRKAPQFTIGQVAKKALTANSGPGPAAYHPKVTTSAQGYSMSSRRKPPRKVKSTPAPNAYKVREGQTSRGIFNGCSASLKSRASPYVYSGFPNLSRITT